MAKELPYFQFEPAEYLTKDISFCSLSAQGLFINICSYYWQRCCQLTKDQVLRRLNYLTELEELISEGVIDFDGDNIVIKFLDNQMEKATKLSAKNTSNGAKGGRPKKPNETQTKPKLNPNESHKIRRDKIKEDNIKEDDIKSIYTVSENVVGLKSNSYFSTQILKNEYKANDEIINAVLSNKANGFDSKEHLFRRLDDFNKHLKEDGCSVKTWSDYCSHFRNWNKIKTKTNKDINPKSKISF
jgi:hypothetical protein